MAKKTDAELYQMWVQYWDLVNQTGCDYLDDAGIEHNSVERDAEVLGMAIKSLKSKL